MPRPLYAARCHVAQTVEGDLRPTGKSLAFANSCPALLRKIFRLTRRATHFYKLDPSRLDEEGRYGRSSRNVGRDAVDATMSCAHEVAGRGQTRERSREARETSGIVADGEVVWSWHPLLMSSRAEVTSAQPGADETFQSAWRRWQKEFVTGESAKEPVKT